MRIFPLDDALCAIRTNHVCRGASCDWVENLIEPRLPVDERPEAVEGDPLITD